MNLHHLELFYYVARYQGIVNACRNMPYGIQQPAMSAQMAALEEDLSTVLFKRRPFSLTPAGEHLYGFLAPFFNALPQLEADLRGEFTNELRIAGPGELLQFHIPEMMTELQRDFRNIKLSVLELDQRGAQSAIDAGETSIAVTVIEHKLPPGFKSLQLIELPLAIFHQKKRGKLPRFDDFWNSTASCPNLIAPPASEFISKTFHSSLENTGRTWRTSIEARGRHQIAAYVASGMGAGLWVKTPGIPDPVGIRIEPLDDFPKLKIGAFWRGNPSPIEQAFLELLRHRTDHYLQEK